MHVSLVVKLEACGVYVHEFRCATRVRKASPSLVCSHSSYMYVCMNMYKYTHTHMYIYIYTYTHTCTHYTGLYTDMNTYAGIRYMRAYIYKHKYMSACK
jgi:hypothetical protein